MDNLLNNAIKRELIKKPSSHFTDKVMDKVFQIKNMPEYSPIISKKGWAFISLVMLLLVSALVIFQPLSVEETSRLVFLDNILQKINSFDFSTFNMLDNVNLLVVSAVSLVVFLLLFFDTLFIKKR